MAFRIHDWHKYLFVTQFERFDEVVRHLLIVIDNTIPVLQEQYSKNAPPEDADEEEKAVYQDFLEDQAPLATAAQVAGMKILCTVMQSHVENALKAILKEGNKQAVSSNESFLIRAIRGFGMVPADVPGFDRVDECWYLANCFKHADGVVGKDITLSNGTQLRNGDQVPFETLPYLYYGAGISLLLGHLALAVYPDSGGVHLNG